MRELLAQFGSADQINTLSEDEIARALLGAMKRRLRQPTSGLPNREHAVGELFGVGGGSFRVVADPVLQPQLERKFRKAWKKLEEQDLIEPEDGMNGRNGFVRLTPLGLEADTAVDAEPIRIRALLKDEMIHPKLRGEPLTRFRNGKYGNAVFEALKIVEIEVRAAAGRRDDEHGVALMEAAFNENEGELSDATETVIARRALKRFASGAIGRFKNPDSHTHRQLSGPMEAIEELMTASRLLRYVDEAR